MAAIGIREHNSPWDAEKTYDVFFFGDAIFTTVTPHPATVTEWISNVKSAHHGHGSLIVGLDVEWRPFFTAGQRSPVATLQLCVGRRCLIYQILHSPYIPQFLADFLSDGAHTFVGVGIKHDLEKLQSDYGVGGNTRYVDLGMLAAYAYDVNELKNAGLKTLVSTVLGKEVEKPEQVTLSRWDNRWLTAEQVKYACVDAFASFEIGRVLNASYY